MKILETHSIKEVFGEVEKIELLSQKPNVQNLGLRTLKSLYS